MSVRCAGMHGWVRSPGLLAVVVLSLLGAARADASVLLSDEELRTELPKLAGRKLETSFFEDRLEKLKLVRPGQVLARAVSESLAPEAVVQRFAETFQVNFTAARALLTATLVKVRSGKAASKDELVAMYGRVLEALVIAAREAPGHPAPAAILLTDYELWKHPECGQRLNDVLLAPANPAESALALLPAMSAGWPLTLWTFAVGERPALLPRALKELGTEGGGPHNTAFYFAALRAKHLPAGKVLRRELREGLVRGLLGEGLPELALEVLESMPAAERAAFQAGRWRVREYQTDLNGDGLRQDKVRVKDVRPDIAAAYLAHGNVKQARAWFEAFEKHPVPESVDAARSSYACEAQMKKTLLEIQLDAPVKHEPFELLPRRECVPGDFPWHLFYAQALAKQYPRQARQFLEGMLRYNRQAKLSVSYGDLPLPFLTPARDAFSAERAQQLQRIQQELTALGTEPAAEGKDLAGGEALRKHLASLPAGFFSERGLPPDAAVPEAASPETVPLKSLQPPKGFRPVLAQRVSGGEAAGLVVVAESQRLDPTGELSGGGYWVLLSKDDGTTWDEPLYTGLRLHHPYVLSKRAQGPILNGGSVRLDVEVRELRPESISFPPVSLDFRGDSRVRTLEAPLASLRRDTDNDSLPDVVEARMLLDPARADSDGDGLADAVDPLPRVARAPRPGDARTDILSQFFFTLAGKQPYSLEHTLYITAPSDALQGVDSPLRLISMSEEEAEVAREHFGTFFPLTFELLFNPQGDQAYLEWDLVWRGGAFLAKRRQDGTWELTPIRSWMT